MILPDCGFEVVRVRVKKYDGWYAPDEKRFSLDPRLTTFPTLKQLLVKAFGIKSDFVISYLVQDRCRKVPKDKRRFLPILSDWDLTMALTGASDPYLNLKVDLKPFEEGFADWDIIETEELSTDSGVDPNPASKPLSSQRLAEQLASSSSGVLWGLGRALFGAGESGSDNGSRAAKPKSPMTDSDFRRFLDSEGRMVKPEQFRLAVYQGGLQHSLRNVAWRHILAIYPPGLTGQERIAYTKSLADKYVTLKHTWQDWLRSGLISDELRSVINMVRKDVVRTDRSHAFFALDRKKMVDFDPYRDVGVVNNDDNANVLALFNVLVTYSVTHPGVSYCQGMSDIASPILVVMKDEADAYVCFCATMQRLRRNFMTDGKALTTKFHHLVLLLQYYDPVFYEYLREAHADDLLFCYRWLLLELKREFRFEDALLMLEVMWSALPPDPPVGELPLSDVDITSPLYLEDHYSALIGQPPANASSGLLSGEDSHRATFQQAPYARLVKLLKSTTESEASSVVPSRGSVSPSEEHHSDTPEFSPKCATNDYYLESDVSKSNYAAMRVPASVPESDNMLHSDFYESGKMGKLLGESTAISATFQSQQHRRNCSSHSLGNETLLSDCSSSLNEGNVCSSSASDKTAVSVSGSGGSSNVHSGCLVEGAKAAMGCDPPQGYENLTNGYEQSTDQEQPSPILLKVKCCCDVDVDFGQLIDVDANRAGAGCVVADSKSDDITPKASCANMNGNGVSSVVCSSVQSCNSSCANNPFVTPYLIMKNSQSNPRAHLNSDCDKTLTDGSFYGSHDQFDLAGDSFAVDADTGIHTNQLSPVHHRHRSVDNSYMDDNYGNAGYNNSECCQSYRNCVSSKCRSASLYIDSEIQNLKEKNTGDSVFVDHYNCSRLLSKDCSNCFGEQKTSSTKKWVDSVCLQHQHSICSSNCSENFVKGCGAVYPELSPDVINVGEHSNRRERSYAICPNEIESNENSQEECLGQKCSEVGNCLSKFKKCSCQHDSTTTLVSSTNHHSKYLSKLNKDTLESRRTKSSTLPIMTGSFTNSNDYLIPDQDGRCPGFGGAPRRYPGDDIIHKDYPFLANPTHYSLSGCPESGGSYPPKTGRLRFMIGSPKTPQEWTTFGNELRLQLVTNTGLDEDCGCVSCSESDEEVASPLENGKVCSTQVDQSPIINIPESASTRIENSELDGAESSDSKPASMLKEASDILDSYSRGSNRFNCSASAGQEPLFDPLAEVRVNDQVDGTQDSPSNENGRLCASSEIGASGSTSLDKKLTSSQAVYNRHSPVVVASDAATCLIPPSDGGTCQDASREWLKLSEICDIVQCPSLAITPVTQRSRHGSIEQKALVPLQAFNDAKVQKVPGGSNEGVTGDVSSEIITACSSSSTIVIGGRNHSAVSASLPTTVCSVGGDGSVPGVIESGNMPHENSSTIPNQTVSVAASSTTVPTVQDKTRHPSSSTVSLSAGGCNVGGGIMAPNPVGSSCFDSGVSSLPPESNQSGVSTPYTQSVEMASLGSSADRKLEDIVQFINVEKNGSYLLPPPGELGDGNPFMLFLCLTLLLLHRDRIIRESMEFNEIAMYFDRLVRKHDVKKVLHRARVLYADYLKSGWHIDVGLD